MADSQTIFRLLDKLIEQTGIDNLVWAGTQEPHEYQFRGASGFIRLTSIDRDGLFPVRFAIIDADGNGTDAWTVDLETEDPAAEAFDGRVRQLWNSVTASKDPARSLLRELEDLPPF